MIGIALAIVVGGLGVAEQSPLDCFPEEVTLDAFGREWFCGHLAAAGEHRLAGAHSYRFTYLPTFHAPRIVVVRVRDGAATIVGKTLSGRGGYDPGSLADTTTRELTTKEFRLLEQRVENAGMWDSVGESESGNDGSQWILEAKRHGRYRFHNVWSPSKETFPQYRKACVFMLELANLIPMAPEKLY